MAFDKIYKDYFFDVYKYLRGLTGNEALAEELAQETFFKAMKSLNSFRGDCEVRVWLCKIAKNTWFTYCEKANRQIELGESDIKSSEDFTQLIENRELALMVHKVLHELNEPYKEIFTLRIFGELSFKEIGDLFDKTDHWACVTFHRAKAKIQQSLGGKI